LSGNRIHEAVELEEAGLDYEQTLAIEGPGWLLQNFFQHWHEPRRRERLLQNICWIETEPSILGMSAPIMVVARKDAV